MKAIYILGVNGSGKSTFYKRKLREDFEKNNIEYINADEIKQQLIKDGMEDNRAKMKSGILATDKIIKCVKDKRDFAFETTFTSNRGSMGSIDILDELKKQNYETVGYFVHTKDVNLNIARVEDRFKKGTGHFVPDEVIKDRYNLCIKNVKENINLFDKLNFIDNTNLDFKISNEKLLSQEQKQEKEKKPFKLKEKIKDKDLDISR